MTSINEIFRTFGPEYLQRYANSMPKTHLKVIDAMIACRTEACGLALYQCASCARSHELYRSCGNRHCPTCQQHKTRQWLEKQINRQLPTHHFLFTFTVPENLRPLMRKNQRAAYSALFKTSSEAIKKLALDQRHIGADLPGFFGVLHTWGRTLQYHPHIHYIVPGGALSSTDGRWYPSRIDFYLPVKALSIIFKAKFRDQMKQAGLFDQIPSEVWHIDWNVDSQAVPCSEACLKYLAPYVFKVAISNSRILKVQDRTVFILYRKSHTNRLRTLPLEIMEFMRRFLQHALPTGFMKVRYYGFMNPNCKVTLDHISSLIEMTCGFNVILPKTDLEPRRSITCPSCGGALRLQRVTPPTKVLLWSG
jgi:putative transposase/transposase-like zinc-binding protein